MPGEKQDIIKKVITKVIEKKARKEALLIMSIASDKDREDFILYYKANNYNAVCMTIDFSKWNLVKNKKITHSPKAYFGEPFLSVVNK